MADTALLRISAVPPHSMDLIKDKVWNGAINVRIEFAEAHFLVLAYRLLYFPLYYPQIVLFFANITGVNLAASPVWLEYENVPLKWNLPVGVLYDLLYLPGNFDFREPWVLQLRHHSSATPYPSDQIIPFAANDGEILYEKATEQVVTHLLKLSCYVLNGNSRAMINLSESKSRALWDSIRSHDYGVFHTIIAQMNPKQINSHPAPKFRVPIKVYLAGSSTLIQLPVTVLEDNRPKTLKSVLLTCLPNVFADQSLGKAFIHGIDVDVLFANSIFKVWQTFRHLDNFLYIIVVIS